jgi:hypothetical protein
MNDTIYYANLQNVFTMEDNVSADSLANMGLNLTDFFFSNSPPSCIVNSITRDKLGMPSFRFSL